MIGWTNQIFHCQSCLLAAARGFWLVQGAIPDVCCRAVVSHKAKTSFSPITAFSPVLCSSLNVYVPYSSRSTATTAPTLTSLEASLTAARNVTFVKTSYNFFRMLLFKMDEHNVRLETLAIQLHCKIIVSKIFLLVPPLSHLLGSLAGSVSDCCCCYRFGWLINSNTALIESADLHSDLLKALQTSASFSFALPPILCVSEHQKVHNGQGGEVWIFDFLPHSQIQLALNRLHLSLSCFLKKKKRYWRTGGIVLPELSSVRLSGILQQSQPFQPLKTHFFGEFAKLTQLPNL